MNRQAYIRAISLIGKLGKKLDLTPVLLSIEEQELVRQCIAEYDFYHGHEETNRPKVGEAVIPAGHVRQSSRPNKGL